MLVIGAGGGVGTFAVSRQLQAMALCAFVRQLGETPEAVRYLRAGRARGKVVIVVCYINPIACRLSARGLDFNAAAPLAVDARDTTIPRGHGSSNVPAVPILVQRARWVALWSSFLRLRSPAVGLRRPNP